jgi:hypothetical protein
MDGISGSFDSLINLGMAMSQARIQNTMSISALKKGLDAEARNALGLIQTVQASPPQVNLPQTGQQIDLLV